jgi:2-aminomuconate deaminase
MLGEGRLEDVAQVAREFAREANADMNFKAIWWLGAVMGENNKYDGKVRDYQPVWGTGNAIVELTPSPGKQIDWEKEFDEGPVATFAAPETTSGTGLESHNVLAGDMSGAEAAAVPQDVIRTEKAPKPVGPYPHARRVGDMLFLSGIGPRKPVTGEIPGLLRDSAGSVVGHDIEVQTRACIENVKTILEESGSSLEKVLDVTVYLTDMRGDFDRFNKIYAEYFGRVQPTRTTVGVDSLPTPIAVELKVIASA